MSIQAAAAAPQGESYSASRRGRGKAALSDPHSSAGLSALRCHVCPLLHTIGRADAGGGVGRARRRGAGVQLDSRRCGEAVAGSIDGGGELSLGGLLGGWQGA